MTELHRSPQARDVVRRVFAVALAAFVFSSGGPVYAESASAGGTAVATYTVIPAPTEVTLCPGQTDQIAVRVSKQSTPTASGKSVAGRPRDLTRAEVGAASAAPSIATVDPKVGTVVPLTFRSGVRSPNSGAWFTVTAQKPGDTRILFNARGVSNQNVSAPAEPGEDQLASLGGTMPTATIMVHVKCKFVIDMISTWSIPGERSHDALGVVTDVRLAPDADGNFGVDATMRNHAAVYGTCTGSVSVQSSNVRLDGHVSPTGKLHVDIVYGPVKHQSAEGCAGRGQTGAGVPRTLSVDVDVNSGAGFYFVQLPHVMDDDAGALQGNTLIYITAQK